MNEYKIYHDEVSRTIVISGLAEVFPEASLNAVFLGTDKIAVRTDNQDWNVLGPIAWTRIRREDDTGFTGVSDCMNYLDTELAKKYEATEINWTGTNW